MNITKATGNRAIRLCLDVARSLTGYFTESGLEEMARDFKVHDLYVVEEDGAALGFISINRKSSLAAEISWLAVRQESHRSGIGSRLLRTAVDDLTKDGFQILEVKTLATTVDYAPYERTHAFYRKHGFISLDIITPFPGWQPDCPCELYVKIL